MATLRRRLFYIFVLNLAISFNVWAQNSILNIGFERLLEINADGGRLHEGTPSGVPRSYDWVKGPRMGAGNNSNGFLAATGWGQVFWSEGSANSAVEVQIRSFQTFLCHGKEHVWSLLQEGLIEGAQFSSDFGQNVSVPPASFLQDSKLAKVKFKYGTAYHFWPKQGRKKLPDSDICGFLVLLEAKLASAISDNPNDRHLERALLIGLGADYWKDTSIAWDNYKTNKDVAIGRLEFIKPSWAWYGLSTASSVDLIRLYKEGYVRAPRR